MRKTLSARGRHGSDQRLPGRIARAKNARVETNGSGICHNRECRRCSFWAAAPAKDQGASCTPQTRITMKSSNRDQVAARLSGIVLDPNGAVISGAQIVIVGRQSSDMTSAVADQEGRFQLDLCAGGNLFNQDNSQRFRFLQCAPPDRKKSNNQSRSCT